MPKSHVHLEKTQIPCEQTPTKHVTDRVAENQECSVQGSYNVAFARPEREGLYHESAVICEKANIGVCMRY